MDEQFGFQTGHSKDHAIAQLVDQIYEAFEKNEYKLGLFIDLSKAFDTVDHSVLLRKLELNQRLLSVIMLLKGKNLLYKDHFLGSLYKVRPFPDRNAL